MMDAHAVILLGMVAACEASLPIESQSCGDRHCIVYSQSGFSICAAAGAGVDGGALAPGEALCEWSGSSCGGPPECAGDADCGAGNVCVVPKVPTGQKGSCLRGAGAVADRTACTRDEDCVPEPCCRPTLCVNRADAVCRHEACCVCADCEACTSSCRCVGGCCVTERGPGDHCC